MSCQQLLVTSRQCKIMFYIGNTFILLSGLVVFILGILMVVKQSRTLHIVFPEYSVRGIGILFIVVGLSIVIVACIAYYAAYKNHRCLMVALITILVILFFIELAGALICIFYTNQDASIVTNRLSVKLSKYYNKKGHEKFTRRVDEIQQTFKCCGADCYLDWVNTIRWKHFDSSPNEIVPKSCCKEWQMGCNHRSPYAERPEQLYSLYHVGCSQRIRHFVGRNLVLYGFIALLMFLIQWIGLIGLLAIVYHIGMMGVCGVCGAAYIFTILTLWHLITFLWDHNLSFWYVLDVKHSGVVSSLVIDSLLMGLMFVQHSGMASSKLKSYLQDVIGISSALIRPFYVAATSLALQIAIIYWKRIPSITLWSMIELSSSWWWFFFWVHLLSWALIYGHCLMLDFGELMGIKQIYYDLIKYEEPLDYKSRQLNRFYEHRRHSVLGLFFILLVHPCMTLDRLLLLLFGTVYVRQFFRVDNLDYEYQNRQLLRKCCT